MVEKVEIKTFRLLLRPFELSDLEDVLRYTSDPQWGLYLPDPRPYTKEVGERFLSRMILDNWDTNPSFAIGLDGEVIGNFHFNVDPKNKIAEVGYTIASNHWGKGLAAEVADAVIDWGFLTYDIGKVFARGQVPNKRSWRVMEKLGMTREGLLRSHYLEHGEATDYYVYGILRKEWDARKANK